MIDNIDKLYKTSEVADLLDVEIHIVRHDTKKYEIFLRDNVKIHENGKWKLYDNEAIRILKIIRSSVKEGKKSDVIFQQLSKALNVPVLTDNEDHNRINLELLQTINDRVSSIDEYLEKTYIGINGISEILKDFNERLEYYFIDKKLQRPNRAFVRKILSLFAWKRS